MSATKTDAPVYTITKFGADNDTDSNLAPGMSRTRKAVIAAALVTAPCTVVSTALTGHAGWTAAVFIADIAALVGSVVGHARNEAAMPETPMPMVVVTWRDYDGTVVRYPSHADTSEAA